jgi:hypothetical protein
MWEAVGEGSLPRASGPHWSGPCVRPTSSRVRTRHRGRRISLVIMANKPIDHRRDRQMLGSGIRFDARNEGLFDMQGPSGGSGGLGMGAGQQVLAPAPPGEQLAQFCHVVGRQGAGELGDSTRIACARLGRWPAFEQALQSAAGDLQAAGRDLYFNAITDRTILDVGRRGDPAVCQTCHVLDLPWASSGPRGSRPTRA